MATPGSLGVPLALLNQTFPPTADDDLSNNPEAEVIWSVDILMRPSGLMEGGQLPFEMMELKNHNVNCRRRADLSLRQDRCRFSAASTFARRGEKPPLILDSSYGRSKDSILIYSLSSRRFKFLTSARLSPEMAT